MGLKFRRQQVIAGFIVDFYCASRRLALELDGAPHDHPDHAEHDARRTQALQKRAIHVLRLRNDNSMSPPCSSCSLRTPSASPPPSPPSMTFQ